MLAEVLTFLVAINSIISVLLKLAPTVVQAASYIQQLLSLASTVAAANTVPTHEQWAQLAAIQTAALEGAAPKP